jgi:hypothetical protein
MPEAEWNSTTAPQEGTIVYVLGQTTAANTRFPSRSFFETIAGGMLAREKSLTLLSRDGDRPTTSTD